MSEWGNNEKSLLSYVEQAQKGIKGTVKDGAGNPVEGAKIRVRRVGALDWRRTVVTTNAGGIFWRILVSGQYEVSSRFKQD